MTKRIIFLLTWMAVSLPLFSQYTCWVEFRDKAGTEGSLSSPEHYLSSESILRRSKQSIAIDSTDLPVSRVYVDSVVHLGFALKSQSKWLNGITVKMADTLGLHPLRALSFVRKVELTQVPTDYTLARVGVRKTREVATDPDAPYGGSLRQIEIHGGHLLHAENFRGEGKTIGVLDGGFHRADSIAAFDSLRIGNRLLGARNFADTNSVYTQQMEHHGTSVLSVMAANIPGEFVGTAPGAAYWLIQTEFNDSEYMDEVDNWVAGIEFADSVGVDIVNSSLGYTHFDYPGMNYTYESMDGRTSRASIAARMAARKGMIVVVAAGNEGNSSWQYISSPADADSILSVGAVDMEGNRAVFSSYGPTADGRVKPDVCAVGSNTLVADFWGTRRGSGTSFASPIIAGLTACVWQALPHLTNIEIIDLMRRYSSRYANPNSELGYGIPDVYSLVSEQRSSNSISSDEWHADQPIAASFVDGILRIRLDGSGKRTYRLSSLTGLLIKEWTGTGHSEQLEVSFLAKGIYLLSIREGGHSRTLKVINY